MRAVVVKTPGGPDAVEIIEVTVPEPAAGEVRIRVEAAAVNPVDIQTREGVYHELGWVTVNPVGLGWDVAGVIDAVGEGVDDFTEGTRVAALFAGVDRPLGAYADYVVMVAREVVAIPDGLSSIEAATVPLNAVTASQTLDLLGAGQGRTLLVTGGAGGVGGYVISLGTERGFAVTALARKSDRAFVEGVGAELITALPSAPAFDAVIDAAVLGAEALAAVRDDGAYVGVVPPAAPAPARGVSVSAVLVTPDAPTLRTLLARTATGELPPRVHSSIPLAEAARAQTEFAQPGLRGRIVLIP